MESRFDTILAHSSMTKSRLLLDGGHIDNLYARLEALDMPFTSLLNGRSSIAYLRIAPFLVAPTAMTTRLRGLCEDAIAANGLVWLESADPLEAIRRRLFRFYHWRLDGTAVYARIADAGYFARMMRVLDPDQSRLLGQRVSRAFVPVPPEAIESYTFEPADGRFAIANVTRG